MLAALVLVVLCVILAMYPVGILLLSQDRKQRVALRLGGPGLDREVDLDGPAQDATDNRR